MAGNSDNGDERHGSLWRIAAWIAAALGLLLPLVAMQFTEEVNWDVLDFVVAGVLLFGSLGTYEIVARTSRKTVYRAAVGVALGAAVLLVWLNGAVGLIGTASNDANLMYFGVLAIGGLGAFVSRFQPQGMARAMFATALVQGVVAGVAMIGGLGYPASPPMELLFLNGFFVALWIGSAVLFQRAVTEQPSADAEREDN